MSPGMPLPVWPVVRQMAGPDRLGLGAAAKSRRSTDLQPRTATADRVVGSICPYCGVGCTLSLTAQDGKIVRADSPLDASVTEGNLCIKGRFGFQHVQARD